MQFADVMIPVAIFAGLGILLGVALAVASRVFAVKTDQRVEKIRDILPGANCGGCGYSGCSALSEAIVKGDAPATACKVCSAAQMNAIGEVLGVSMEAPEATVAKVLCAGVCGKAKQKYRYEGAQDCLAADRMGGGDKACPAGCIGLGSCVTVCKYGALSVIDGVARVDAEKCIGCGSCMKICPKHIIVSVPKKQKYYVSCHSPEPGAVTGKQCSAGCIGCKICEKNCPADAIHVNGGLASIDYSKCISCGVCAEKCPKKIIKG